MNHAGHIFLAIVLILGLARALLTPGTVQAGSDARVVFHVA